MIDEKRINKYLNFINFENLNVNPNLTNSDLFTLISNRIYWVAFDEPDFDNRWNLLSEITNLIIVKIKDKWTLSEGTVCSLYDGVCVNCQNYSDYLQFGVCNICRDYAQNGIDVEPYFLSKKQRDIQMANIKNDFFPIVNKQNKNSTLTFLYDLIDELGYIPKSTELDYSSNPGRLNLKNEALWRLGLQNNINLFRSISRTCSGEWYKMMFGSWFETLVEAQILYGAQRKSLYGTTCLANDGHICHSIGEKIIDDWLSKNNIIHIKEPFYPLHPLYNRKGKFRADWKINNHFLEFCGLKGVKIYDIKTSAKVNIAKECNIELILIFQEDLKNLNLKLGAFLNL